MDHPFADSFHKDDCLRGGTVINPHAFEGQLEGGMDQGVGYALREEYKLGKQKDYVSFKFPTIRHFFDTEIIALQTPRSNGPFMSSWAVARTNIRSKPWACWKC